MSWKKNVRIFGIVDQKEDALYLKWSASGIEFETCTERIEGEIWSECGILTERAYIGVYVGKEREPLIYKQKIRIDPGKKTYVFYENLRKEKLKVRLLKITEEQYGNVGIVCMHDADQLYPTQVPEHKLLFIGDSITAGYGINGINNVRPFTTVDEDASKSYAYLTGEMLRAETGIVACSGNGIISRWIPSEQEFPDTNQILPKIFPWKMEYNPSLIVCNLGTNDASYIRQISTREQQFTEQYRQFIQKLQEKFKETPILLTYGVMEKTMSRCVKKTAEICNVFYQELPLQDKEEDLGTDAHPGEVTHRKISEILDIQIRKIMAW